jgi:Xaa-Pro aminopeptidase
MPASPTRSPSPTLIDQLRARLVERGADAAWISDPVSIAYLTGFWTEPHERLMGLALTPAGAVLVVPGLEVESASRAVGEVEVVGWRDGEDPYAAAGRALGDAARTVAVEKSHLTLAVAENLRTAVGIVEFADLGPTIRALRLHKRPDELERLQRAAAITDRVAAEVIGSLEPGTTEIEVANRVAALIGAEGATLSFDTIVQSCANSAEPHLRPTRRRLEQGDLVLLDFGAAWEGYKADITRTVVLGRPDARQREVHQAVLDAHDAGVAAIRPGVQAGDVDRAAREVLERAGLGEYFIHRLGHGLGLEAHEDPSLDPGSTVPLEEGMVVTVEPGVYIPGWGGVRIEDDVVVEAGGARLLTGADRGVARRP